MLSVDLAHRFPGLDLSVRFDAPPGVTALFGRSGAGKTTVVRAVAGLLTPDRGRVVVDGRVLLDSDAGINLPPSRRRVGYVFQDARLFPHLSVRGNLEYGLRFAPRDAAGATLDDIAAMLGITHLLSRRPAGLSGGERGRVGIGRALLARPRLLILDEPMAALDTARRAEIMPSLERLRDQSGVPILYISHAIDEVARLATTLVIIDAGRVVASGPLSDVVASPQAAAGLDARDAGAVLTLHVVAHDPDGITRLAGRAGTLLVPGHVGRIGEPARIRVAAQDVMIATSPPQGISALNILPATVSGMQGQGDSVLVRLSLAQGEHVLARVTARSCTALGLAEGRAVHAIVKALSLVGG